MRKVVMTVLVSLVALLPYSTALAENGNWLFEITTGINSQYLARPGMVLYNRPLWENSFAISHALVHDITGYAGVWGVIGLNDRGLSHKKDYGDEFNGFVGLRRDLFGFLGVDLRGSYFALKHHRDDLWVIDGVFHFKNPYITPYVAIRYFGEVEDRSPNKGWLSLVGLKKSIPLSDTANLYLNTFMASSDGVLGRDPSWFVYGRVQVGAEVKVAERNGVAISLLPSVTIQLPAANQNGHPKDYTGQKEKEVAFGILIKFSFKK